MTTMRKNTLKRLLFLDFLRDIAILGVILIHTTSITLENSGFDVTRIPLTLFLNIAARFAVPLFFLISGFALEYRYPGVILLQRYYKRRVARILVPYLIWSTLYFFYSYGATGSLIVFFRDIVLGDASFHFYFIPTIILFYALFPLLHKYSTHLLQTNILLIIALLEIYLVFLDYYFIQLPLVTPLRVFLLSTLFFFLGMYLTKHDQILSYVRKRTIIFLIIAATALCSAFAESRNLYLFTHGIEYIYNQWRFNIYVYTVALAALLYNLSFRLATYASLITLFSQTSFFIYFIHVIFIKVFWRFIGSYLFSKTAGHIVDTIFFDLAVYVFVVGCSFGVAMIVRRIPKLAWALGA